MGKVRIKRPRTDRGMIIIYLFLVLAGLVMLNSVGAPPDGYEGGIASRLGTLAGKQFLWALLSAFTWLAINYFVDRNTWIVGAYPIYAACLALLVLVLLFGKEINGARSWFSVAGLTFQPSELAKFGTCLAMAAFLSQYSEKLGSLRNAAYGFLIWLLPAAVILFQPDPGSMLVFSSFLLVMYREGLTPLLYILGGFTALMLVLGILYPPIPLLLVLLVLALVFLAFTLPNYRIRWGAGAVIAGASAVYAYFQDHAVAALIGVSAALVLLVAYHLLQREFRLVAIGSFFLVWGTLLSFAATYTFDNVLRPHHRERINVWLRPEGMDPRGPVYNLLQSKLAIAAGGVKGKGLQQGTMTKYDYVPAQQTDFIFSAIGEEQGFFGASMIILIFALMIWRITVIAERQRRVFARAYAYGVAGILLVHVLVNIGMTMGLLPVIGIPLPFISKGGSSLLSFTIMLAVLLKLDKHRAEV